MTGGWSADEENAAAAALLSRYREVLAGVFGPGSQGLAQQTRAPWDLNAVFASLTWPIGSGLQNFRVTSN